MITATPTDRATLLAQLQALPERPFLRQVVQSPWDAVTTIKSLHVETRYLAQQLIAHCRKPNAIRTLTIAAPPGYGKTHLLAWIRYACERRAVEGMFIYVTPYLFGSGITFDQHLMRAVVQGLYLRSANQKSRFVQPLRAFLTTLLDASTENILGDSLAVVVQQPEFLERAFVRFVQLHPQAADGVRLHRDTFFAVLLMVFAEPRFAWCARRWLEGEAIPPLPMHTFPAPLQGSEEIRDALYTLQTLAPAPLCLAFDQMEDTAQSLPAPTGTTATGWGTLATTLRMLFTLPGYCSLFLFQQSVWQHFATQAPGMLVDRMIEGNGVRMLAPLTDAVATDLLAERMKRHVWDVLKQTPPEPLFPFTADHVRSMRIQSGGEVRGFLRLAHEEYERQLHGQPTAIVAKPRLRLIDVSPEVNFTPDAPKLVIRAEALPPHVLVFFGDQAATAVTCKPAAGEISVAAPPHLMGDVLLLVRDKEDESNTATLPTNLTGLNVRRPYSKHVDRQKLKTYREQLGLTLQQVATKAGCSATTVSNLESGQTKNPADELFEKLATVYGKPLRDFVKQKK